MTAILTLLICLIAQPHVCETVNPALTRVDGASLTYFECLGTGGQSVAQAWLAEHPQYALRRIQCTLSNGSEKQILDRLLSPEA